MRKRPLVIGTMLFFLGILISFYKLSWLIVVVSAAICTAYFIKKEKARLFAVALIIILLGSARMNVAQTHADAVISRHLGRNEKMTLVISKPTTDGKTIAFLETDEGKIGVYLTVKKRCELSSGDIVTGKIRLHVPTESKIGPKAFSNYLASQGVYLQASAENVKTTGRYEKGVMGKIYTLRNFASNLGRTKFEGDRRALFNAMVLGDKSLVSDRLDSSLQGSGLSHIAVVSGMHLSVVIAFIIFIARRIFGKGRVSFVVAILSAVFITLLTGAGASVVRALIMCFIYYLSRILYRENDGITSLFCAFLVMVIINPYIIFDVGFVLSVLSVLGIILYNEKLSEFLKKLMPEKVAEAISLTLSAQLALTPAIVYYFGVITPYAPFSNILAVPLSAVYVVLGMLFVILSPIKPIAVVLSSAISFFADGIVRLCESISSLPLARVEYIGSFWTLSVAWVFIAIIIFAHPIARKNLKKFAAAFGVAVIVSSFIAQIQYDNIIFTPYGRETLAYVETAEDSFLIDCPDLFDVMMADLPYENIVITNNQIQDAMSIKREPRRIIVPGALHDETSKSKLQAQAKESGAKITFMQDGDKVKIGSATLRYIDIGAKTSRALEINLSGKKIITLQGFSRNDIEKMVKNRVKFRCDYLYIPYEIEERETLASGKIISNNKFSLQR